MDPNDTFIGGYEPYVRLQQEIENGKLHNQMLQQALQLAPQELQIRQQQLAQQKQMGDAQIAQIYGMLPAHQAMAMSSVNEANAKIADLKQTTEISRQLQAGLLESQKYKLQQEKALADTASQTADLRLRLGEEEVRRAGISGNTEQTRNLLLNQQIPTIIAQSKADLQKTLAETDQKHTETKSLKQQIDLLGVQKEMSIMNDMKQWPEEMRKQIISAHADETTPLFNILKAKPELLTDDKFIPYVQMIEGKMMKDPVIGPQLMAAEFEKKFDVPLPNQPQVVSPSMVNPGENFRKALNDATSKFYKDFPAPAPGQKQPKTMPPSAQGGMPQTQAQPAGTPSGVVQQGASNDVALTDFKNALNYVDQQKLPENAASARYSSPEFKKAIDNQSVWGILDEESGGQHVRFGDKIKGKGFMEPDQQAEGNLDSTVFNVMRPSYAKNLKGELDPMATPQQTLKYRAVLDTIAHTLATKRMGVAGSQKVDPSTEGIGEYTKATPKIEQILTPEVLKGLSEAQQNDLAIMLGKLGIIKPRK